MVLSRELLPTHQKRVAQIKKKKRKKKKRKKRKKGKKEKRRKRKAVIKSFLSTTKFSQLHLSETKKVLSKLFIDDEVHSHLFFVNCDLILNSNDRRIQNGQGCLWWWCSWCG
jgi:hypothetical protein